MSFERFDDQVVLDLVANPRGHDDTDLRRPDADRERNLVLAASAELEFQPKAAPQLLRRRTTNTRGVLYTALNHFESRFVEILLERAPTAGPRAGQHDRRPGRRG